MKLEVTRNVISDLWPLCQSAEASADSRELVDAFLREDAAFARTLKESAGLSDVVPHLRLSADAERRLLDGARDRARMKLLLAGGAIAMTALILLACLVAVLFFLAPPR